MVLAKYGENTELDEDASGNTVIRNTATGTEVLLADFVDIVGSFGSAANRIDGESFFDQLNANSVETSTVIDSDDATSYDVGDDLASGAFSDGDNDGTYTLPNPDDGIEVGSVNTEQTNYADTGADVTQTLWGQIDANDGGGFQCLAGDELTVGTSGSVVYRQRPNDSIVNSTASTVWVVGSEEADPSTQFFDRVEFLLDGTPNQTILDIKRTPSDRDYAAVNNHDLELTMSDNEYRVYAFGLSPRVFA